ncbi:MAG: flagellar protein [uncultured bacterium]|nr:MAG: flagellar protein [uncultured bacterium]
MFAVKTCPDCGILFIKFSGRVCPKCHSVRQQQLNNAIGLAKSRPGLPLKEIGRLCNVSERTLQDFAEEGTFRRLNLSVRYPCRLCSAPINNGTICSGCHEELARHIVDLRSKLWAEKGVMRPVQVSGQYESPFSSPAPEDSERKAEALKEILTSRSKSRRSLRHGGQVR